MQPPVLCKAVVSLAPHHAVGCLEDPVSCNAADTARLTAPFQTTLSAEWSVTTALPSTVQDVAEEHESLCLLGTDIKQGS